MPRIRGALECLFVYADDCRQLRDRIIQDRVGQPFDESRLPRPEITEPELNREHDTVGLQACPTHLLIDVAYRYQAVYIKFVGTHAEYDKIDVTAVKWKGVNHEHSTDKNRGGLSGCAGGYRGLHIPAEVPIGK
ncbi:type II toxin-antitoxin system HigB family toxin [Paludibacterium yongneupense]|uniref:type II toxin-antitoxin system HigB family toxin n=1 Tax=Paludibacterium yongneupense TaxID=400061 RepID=UPI0003FF9C41|nr:type II toxin-antitoxin system HigB family toxin [Paludibacterium yongneupense]